MKAVVLVGGKGTRLEPLTLTTPKAMIPVLNVPFMEYVIRNLAGNKISEIVLAVGHMFQPISDYLGDGSRFGVKLDYSIEDAPLGTAGAVKNAEKYLDETFLVFNGDDFIDLNLPAMLAVHKNNKAKVTIALTRVENPTAFGLVETDANHKVLRFLEKPKPEEVTTDTINAGAWLVEPEVMSRVPPETQYSFERSVFPDLLSNHEPVYAYPSRGYWMDAGTPEKYLQLHHDLLSGKSSQYTPPKGVIAGKMTKIHPTVKIVGKAIIGHECLIGADVKLTGPIVIGDHCAVGADSLLNGSVVWDHTILQSGVTVKESIIADHCLIGAGCSLDGAVVGANVTLAANTTLEPGSKINPNTTIG